MSAQLYRDPGVECISYVSANAAYISLMRCQAVSEVSTIITQPRFTVLFTRATLTIAGIGCRRVSVGPIANVKGHYFQPSLSVSLSVCLSVCVCLTGTSTLHR